MKYITPLTLQASKTLEYPPKTMPSRGDAKHKAIKARTEEWKWNTYSKHSLPLCLDCINFCFEWFYSLCTHLTHIVNSQQRAVLFSRQFNQHPESPCRLSVCISLFFSRVEKNNRSHLNTHSTSAWCNFCCFWLLWLVVKLVTPFADNHVKVKAS